LPWLLWLLLLATLLLCIPRLVVLPLDSRNQTCEQIALLFQHLGLTLKLLQQDKITHCDSPSLVGSTSLHGESNAGPSDYKSDALPNWSYTGKLTRWYRANTPASDLVTGR
jgi:hypothetical protein